MPRRAQKQSRGALFNQRDENEPAIIGALAAVGVEWYEAGPLDGWVWIGDQAIPVEIKMPGRPLEPDQAKFIRQCLELGRPVMVLTTWEQAIQWVQERRALRPVAGRVPMNPTHLDAVMEALTRVKKR